MHEGEIWRKLGRCDWMKILIDQTPGSPDYDGGLPGYIVVYGNVSSKTKKPIFRDNDTMFVPVKNYDELVEYNHREHRHLIGEDFDNYAKEELKNSSLKPVDCLL